MSTEISDSSRKASEPTGSDDTVSTLPIAATAEPAPEASTEEVEEPVSKGGRGWKAAAIVLFLLLAISVIGNGFQFLRQQRLAGEARGIGAALDAESARADGTDQKLSELRGEVEAGILALQTALTDFSERTAEAADLAATGDPLAGEGVQEIENEIESGLGTGSEDTTSTEGSEVLVLGGAGEAGERAWATSPYETAAPLVERPYATPDVSAPPESGSWRPWLERMRERAREATRRVRDYFAD